MTGTTLQNDHEGGGCRSAGRWRLWMFAGLALAAFIGFVFHLGEIGQFAALLARAKPVWLILAIILQLSTYASIATGWSLVLSTSGTPIPLGKLVRVAVTKLFADQVLPSAGMGGNVLLVDQLQRRGADEGAAVAALLLSMLGYYIAFAGLALLTFVLLWFHDQATPLMAGTVTLFLLVAVAIPSLALWLRRRGSRPLPHWVERIGPVRSLLESVAKAPTSLLRNRRLLARVTCCNALIFLADAATLLACLNGLGVEARPDTALIALIMAQIVVTLGPIPLGLGSFEATSTAMLRLLGVPLEAAFAATMLLRLLTLWLPLVPGLVLMRSFALGRRIQAQGPER
ncbi:TIGR00374 family protein [Rhizorhabdus wittichii DC-6]|nr:TIGR00374 family protein [Rhizorhabdus wittichii DC-6]